MSLQIVEIDTGNNPSIVYINQGPQGQQGDAGPAGPSVIVDQTVIDGSANAVSGNAVFDALAIKAPLASPTFTGIVTAPRITGRCDGLEVLCKAGLAIAAGQVVYVTGASGNNIVIGLARANAEATSSKTIGISESTLANNATGYVITEGMMTVSISAPTANAGDPIWLSPATAGSMVFGLANKPSAPNHIVYLGVVTRKTGNTVVEIYVKVQNGAELDELSDVSITSPVAGQALMRGASLWENRALVSNDISDSSTGGNGAADAGKLVEFNTEGGASFRSDAESTYAVVADSVEGFGVYATSVNGIGVLGSSTNFDGVLGLSQTGNGIRGLTIGTSPSAGVYGDGQFNGLGVYGTSSQSSGVAGVSTNSNGVYAFSNFGAGLKAITQGTYHAYFGNGTGEESFVARLKGAFGWVRGEGGLTARIQAVDTLTTNRIYTLPDNTGTVALIDPSSGTQTFSGAQIFNSTTRPTSSATTATLAAAPASSLITKGDGDSRYGAFYNGVSIPQVSSTDTTPIKVASVVLPIGVYQIDSLVASVHGTTPLCTIGLRSSHNIRITAYENYGNDNTAHVSSPIASDALVISQRSAFSGVTFSRRVTGIVEIITAGTELSIEYSQATTDATASLTRKRAYITATKLS